MSAMLYREPNQVKWVGVRPAHNGEQVAKSGTAVNNTVIIHTVTAGKNLYLVTAQIFTVNSVAAYGNLWVRDGADATWLYLGGLVSAAGQAIPGQTWYSYPPVEVPAGYDICVVSTALAFNVVGSIFGWEE